MKNNTLEKKLKEAGITYRRTSVNDDFWCSHLIYDCNVTGTNCKLQFVALSSGKQQKIYSIYSFGGLFKTGGVQDGITAFKAMF